MRFPRPNTALLLVFVPVSGLAAAQPSALTARAHQASGLRRAVAGNPARNPVARQPAPESTSAPRALGQSSRSPPRRSPASPSGFCADAERDAAQPGSCLEASSVPTWGTLLPLGPELNADDSGHVGIGTSTSARALDVAGDLHASGRLAVGNVSEMPFTGNFLGMCDLSTHIQDFSESSDWTPPRSYFYVDPTHAWTGHDATYLRHLGVIAQDRPSEILARDGKGVGLVDGAAFLLAGLEAQQGEIDALRAEVAQLRADRAR